MVRQCQVCGKLGSFYPELSFHRFPTNPEKKLIWFSIVGFTDNRHLPKNPEICSDHFDPGDIIRKQNGLRYVKPGATPKPRNDSSSSDSTVYETLPQKSRKKIVKMEESERSLFHGDTSNDCNVLPSHTRFNLPNDTVMEDAFTDGPLDLKEEPKLLEIDHTELEMHQICICCLGTDNVSNMKDIFIDGIPSIAIYEKISNNKVEIENMSVGMCLQCIGELAKIEKFIDMSKRSYTVFSRAAQEIKEMNNQGDINAKQYKIKKTNILKDVLGKNHVLPCESDKIKLNKKSTRESCVLQKDLPRKEPVKRKENLLENTSLNIDKEKIEPLSKEIVQDICPLCSKEFRHLIEHLHSIHSLDWNNSKCLQCSYINPDKDKLVKHCKECSNVEFKYDNSDYFETEEVKLEWTEETDECNPNFEPDELERAEMEEIGAEAEQLKSHSNTKTTYLLCNMEL